MPAVRIEAVLSLQTPDSLAEGLLAEHGVVLLRTGQFDVQSARYSFVTAQPVLTFSSFGSRCELRRPDCPTQCFYGNPWDLLQDWLAKFELLEESHHAFPLGGAFGYWGFELKQFTEPRLTRRAVNDLELPDCHVGFYPSLAVFDHASGEIWIVATGLDAQGERSEHRQEEQLAWWRHQFQQAPTRRECRSLAASDFNNTTTTSSISREGFLGIVRRAQAYIRSGDIYQVNLAQRLSSRCMGGGWEFFLRLARSSPAPFSAYYNAGSFELVSSSPELFLRLSGRSILTRPIKGTRPRDSDPARDERLRLELESSEKERSELVMITDLLRNDLGRICEFGSIRVPELFRLEQFPQVQHLVSTVEGQLRPEVTHLNALAACFPGGSVTGAPKIRALEIIDELEPVARGPYCGCHGYLGFNRESQLSITIRTAVVRDGRAWFHVGAGIVADSIPEAEYEETLAKAQGLLTALAGSASTHGEADGRPFEHESVVPLTDADE